MIYTPLCNDLRHLYGHPNISETAVKKILLQLLPEVLTNLTMDSVLGSIPIIGIYFSAMYGKALTWWVGSLFTFLSSRGLEIPEGSVHDAMALIRQTCPPRKVYRFGSPNRNAFVRLMTVSN
jgi:hypothetical protein